jgi:hypothetical protein
MFSAHAWEQLAGLFILVALDWIATDREKRERPGQPAPDPFVHKRQRFARSRLRSALAGNRSVGDSAMFVAHARKQPAADLILKAL